jgi:DNA-binding SARP family transcriptional activator
MNICSHKALVIFGAVILFFAGNCLPARSQGLVFSSYEQVQEKRTFLMLHDKAPLCLGSNFGLSFNFTFFPDRSVYYGYLVRLINNHHQHIDLIYNHKDRKFNIIFGDAFTPLNFQLDSSVLFHRWNTCSLQYKEQMLSLTVNGKPCGSTKIALEDQCFRIFFGACQLHSFKTTDVPPMQLKEVSLWKGTQLFASWPLNELTGKNATDSISGRLATVANPVWGTPLHQQWQLLQTLTVKGNGSYSFYPSEEAVHIVSTDSIYHFLLRDKALRSEPLVKPVYLSAGYQSIYHPGNRTLYSIHIDQRQLAAYVPGKRNWDIPFDSTDITEYWQTNKFINNSENALYVLGGYGQLKYKNLVQRCSFDSRKWEILPVQQSDYKPRYLSALGVSHGGDTAYILGGYGSGTGEQMLNPTYYYDLLRFDVKSKTIKKLFSLPEPQEPFVFASAMVIDTTDHSYYALMFPNDRFKSRLQLIKGSLLRPEYQLAGDTIPYAFLDNRSGADLYYCARTNQLLAVTQVTDRDKSTQIKIYSLAFPPGQLSLSTAEHKAGMEMKWWLFLLAGTGIVAALAYYLYKWRQEKTTAPKRVPVTVIEEVYAVPVTTTAPEVPVATGETWSDRPDNKAALLLFGEFQVIDKDKNSLTHLFSPLLKEMFLLIVIHTAWSGKGISSEKLYELLWHDKSERDARNNRSVNMVKLKGILEKLGSGVILREEGRWKIQYDPALLWIDLADFSGLVKSGVPGMDGLTALLKIVKDGTFLYRTEYAWLEDIKSEISSRALDVLLMALNQLPPHTAPETCIEIANAIFVFDPIHEEALRIKCKTLIQQGRLSLARSVYEKFCKDYRHMYGETFGLSFQEIIS